MSDASARNEGEGAGADGGAEPGVAARAQRSGSPVVSLINVLRCFTVENPRLGVSEIAEMVGLHKSSVSRLLATMQDEHLVERDEATRKYRLGMGLIGIAGPLLAGLDVRRIAYPVLEELCQRSGETTALLVWDGMGAVCVEQLPSARRIKHTAPLGSRYLTPMSSTVQVFLSCQHPEVAHDLWTRSESMAGGPDVTRPATIEGYLERLQEVRRAGVAVNYGETFTDEVGVAAPVVEHRGTVVAAVLIAAPRYRIDTDRVAVLRQLSLEAADEISRRLGHHRLES